MKVEKPKTVRTTIKLIPKQLHANFASMTRLRGSNMADQLRKLIEEFCVKFEKDGFYAWGNNERFPSRRSKKAKIEKMYARLVISITPELLARLGKGAKWMNISKSLVCRRLIDKWCRVHRDSKVKYVHHIKKQKVTVKETMPEG